MKISIESKVLKAYETIFVEHIYKAIMAPTVTNDEWKYGVFVDIFKSDIRIGPLCAATIPIGSWKVVVVSLITTTNLSASSKRQANEPWIVLSIEMDTQTPRLAAKCSHPAECAYFDINYRGKWPYISGDLAHHTIVQAEGNYYGGNFWHVVEDFEWLMPPWGSPTGSSVTNLYAMHFSAPWSLGAKNNPSVFSRIIDPDNPEEG